MPHDAVNTLLSDTPSVGPAGPGVTASDDSIAESTAAAPGSREARDTVEGMPVAAVVDGLARVEQAVRDGLTALLDEFERKLAYDAAKQRQVDALHGELQQHRSNLVARAMRPLVRGVIRLHDDVGKQIATLRARSPAELTVDAICTMLGNIQEDVELLLVDNEVQLYREDVGRTFDPARQRAARKVESGDPALNGLVAASVRPGFEQGGEIIEKEAVAVYVIVPSTVTAPSSQAAPTPDHSNDQTPTPEQGASASET